MIAITELGKHQSQTQFHIIKSISWINIPSYRVIIASRSMRLFEKDIEPIFEKHYEKVVDLEEEKKKGTTAQLLHIILASRTRSEEKAHLFPNRKTEF